MLVGFIIVGLLYIFCYIACHEMIFVKYDFWNYRSLKLKFNYNEFLIDSHKFIEINPGKSKAILFCRGNYVDYHCFYRHYNILLNQNPDYTIYSFNYDYYNGYENFYKPGLELYNFIMSKYHDITIIGYSMGGAAALRIYKEAIKKPKKIYLVNTFSDLKSINWFIKYLFPHNIDNLNLIKNLDFNNTELNIVTSKNDTLIESTHSIDLQKAANANLISVEGDHCHFEYDFLQ